eukprot:6326876-Ditylum_brightwellii.AAC.1
MSANKCPFKINVTVPNNTDRKDLHTSFDIWLDPANAKSITALHSMQKLNANDVKRILMFLQSFDDIIDKANIPEGGQHWTLFESLLLGLPKTKWTNCATAVVVRNQPNFEATIELWLTNFMSTDVSNNIFEWLCSLQKPKDMSVNSFAARLDHFNKLVCYCPQVNCANLTPLNKQEKIAALKKARPNSWKPRW